MSEFANVTADVAATLKEGLLRIGSGAAERLQSKANNRPSTAKIGEERMRLAQICAAGFSDHPDLGSGEAIWAIQRVALAAFDKRLAELDDEAPLRDDRIRATA